MKKTDQKTARFPIGKIIAIAIIILCVLCVVFPQALVFLSPTQQEMLYSFQQKYFSNAFPTEAGSFDFLRLAAVGILFGTCYVLNLAVVFVADKIKLKNRHSETLKGLICNCIKYAIVIFAIIFGLSIMGVNMVAIITSLGVIGLVIGFGTQSLIEDVITGLFIIFEGQFQVGDIVSIDAFRGTVTGIGIRTTSLTDGGGNIKTINNSDIRTVVNLSHVDSYAVSDVSISYGAPLEKAEEVIGEILVQMPVMYPDVFKLVPTYGGVQELAASGVVLRVMAKVAEANIYKAKRLLNRELKLGLDRANIEIPFTQIVIHNAK
ncbi:MAG: mechanosensitive ion channel family protein [Oscillospiraceae bacterium]